MGIILLAPFLIIRFGLLYLLNKDGIKRAAHFPPLLKNEQRLYWIYQLSNAVIIISLLFLKIKYFPFEMFISGVIIYIDGIIFLTTSVINFAFPSKSGINQKGVYRLSRNPMYLSYFIYFLGCVLITQSIILLASLLLFQVSCHWIIFAEERWCEKVFGSDYVEYKKRVKRYI